MATKLTVEILLKNGFREDNFFGDKSYEFYEGFGDGSNKIRLEPYSDEIRWDAVVMSMDKYEDEPSLNSERKMYFINVPLTVEELQAAIDLCKVKKTIKI